MLLKWNIKHRKNKLNKYIEKYGLNNKETIKQSEKLDKLINKYYNSTER